jgi:exopolysaccharide biosynthesis polyprenyl glycosylphosphotransferase
MRKRSEFFFSIIQVPIDFLALMSAFVLAYIIRVKLADRPVAHAIPAMEFLQVILILVPLWILIFAVSGLYSQTNLRGRWNELGKIFVAVSGGVMMTILLDFLQPISFFPSKSVPIYAYGIGLLLVIIGRYMILALQQYLFTFGIGVQNALLVGSGEAAQQLYRYLGQKRSGFRVLGCVDKAKGAARRMPGLPVYTSFQEALSVTGTGSNRRQLDQIIQADSAFDAEAVLEMVSYASNHHINYRFVPNQFGLYAARSVVGTLGGVTMVEMRLTPLEGWGRIAKRLFDIIGSLMFLVLLAPAFVAIAALIKLKDPKEPLIFRHRRLSRDGQPVFIYKFRTMLWKYCDGPNRPFRSAEETFKAMGREDLVREFQKTQKVEQDPRVSRFGKFLRRTSLDELPQLWNVLKGDLSMVGPRPIIPAELDHYGEHKASFLALKPGLTGLWQISGRSDLSYEERVKLDIYYVEHWSLLLDVRILLKTVFALLGTRGAY